METRSNKEKLYKLLYKQIDSLLNPNDPIITNLSNVSAAFKQTFTKISWVGFYLVKNDFLFLGPFQGKVACTKIEIGKGVCGISALEKKSYIVPNVHKFPGHIACDVETNSEIVVPLIYAENVIGVIDVDSKIYSAFDDIDKLWIENISKCLSQQLNLANSLLV